MGKVGVAAKLTAAAGKRDELVSAMGELVKAVDDEPGTLVYVMLTDTKDEDVVWFFELYEDEDAMKAHSRSDTMKAVGGKLGGLVGGAPELHVLTPVAGKGVSL